MALGWRRRRVAALALGALALLSAGATRAAGLADPLDSDNDGVPDDRDCAPLDPRLSTAHVYYWDLDGDQQGDRGNPLLFCSVLPPARTAPWANDPDDSDIAAIAAPAPRGSRILGVDFLDPPANGAWRADLARELGAEAATLHLLWAELETSPGVFDGTQAPLLSTLNYAYASDGFKLSLTVSPLAQTYLTIPPDLAARLAQGTIRLSDREFIERFDALLDFIRAGLPNVELASLQIGHEVDRYFEVRPDVSFWQDFAVFYQAAAAHAKTLWGPELRVGLTATRAGLVNQPTRDLMRNLNGFSDIVSLTYLPRNADFTAIEPAQVEPDVQEVLALYYPKPLCFQSVGYPSSPRTGSSQTKQTQFLYALFDVWDRYPDLIPFVALARLHDYSKARAGLEAGRPHYQATPETLPTAMAYIESLGFRTYAEAGEPKPSYHTLRSQAFARGFWRVKPRPTRSYRMGFSPNLYDHVPLGPIRDDVLDNLFATIATHADLVAYHFDKGVPWVEALADDFSSPEPPYSQNLREVWSQYRSRQPPGKKVAVSINPLGIPRERLAAYWGVGEGYYLDQNFRPVGTGVIQDYEDRLLPSPWNTYGFDSPPVKTAFLNYARRVMDYFQPDYLIIGVEVNLAAMVDPAAFARYVQLQQYLYQEIRARPAYDKVRIVVSFTAEHFMADELGVPLLNEAVIQPGLTEISLQSLRALLPATDLVGLSVYPIKSRFGADFIPASMFSDLFGRLRAETRKPLAITETGYPAAPFRYAGRSYNGSPEKQARFMRLLFEEAAKEAGLEFIVNFGVRDMVAHMDNLRACSQQVPPCFTPQLTDFFQFFEHIGLLDKDGNPRAATQVWLDALAATLVERTPPPPPIELASPNGKVVALVGVHESGRLFYSLKRDGFTALEDSPLGVTVDGVDLGTEVRGLAASSSVEVDETYPVYGTHSQATNRCRETRIRVTRQGSGDGAYEAVFRLYDDGLAFRYVIPGAGEREIGGEASGWTLPRGSIVWHEKDTRNYEADYRALEIGGFGHSNGPPLTAELPGGAGYLVISEGGLRSYSGMTVNAFLGSRILRAQFLDDEIWRVQGGSPTPWRLAIVSADLNGLVNSDMVSNVSDPPDAILFPKGLKTAWIRPGRAVWSWWSDFDSGYFFDIQRHYVDHAHRLGFEYSVVDAFWEEGFPAGGQDQFQRLAELVGYAHRDGRSVDIWVWKAWYEMRVADLRRAFLRAVKAAGAVGVKVDNLAADDSESAINVVTYEAILKDAAELQLMVNFHGCNKPTGLSRTYPNEITREGLMSLEINSLLWERQFFVPAYHNAILPFTRFVAGAGDYTPLTFDPRKIGDTTFTHQLATMGLFTSPLQHLAEDPELVLAQTGVLDVLTAIPTVWDETVVLPQSRISELAGFARRSGDRWFLFVINGNNATVKRLSGLDLSFLGPRSYEAVLVSDRTRTGFAREERAVTGRDRLEATLLEGGGFVGMFTPSARSFRLGFQALPPHNDPEGWDVAYRALRDHSDIVAHSFQQGIPWPEARLSSDVRTYSRDLQDFWRLLRTADETVLPRHDRYILINPIEAVGFRSLAPHWGETNLMPLPPPWDRYDFNHPDVKRAFTNFAIAAVEYFQPKYLAIAVEANILLARRPEQWEAFKELQAHVYRTLKALYPSLTVFATVNYEHMLGLHRDSQLLAERLRDTYPDVLENEVRELLRASDLLALSTYPYMVEGLVVGEDYYDRALALARETARPLAVDQTGYISRDVFQPSLGITLRGSEKLQADFVGFLLKKAYGQRFEFLINFVPADYGANYGTDDNVMTWAYAGLLNEDGTAKAALATWDAFRELPYERRPEAQGAADGDGDGVSDSLDCGPADPALSSYHLYYRDRDGDGYGDFNDVMGVCALDPPPGYSLWGGDPDDGTRAVQPRPHRRRSLLGLEFIETSEEGTFAGDNLVQARALGAQVSSLHLNWSWVEPQPGVYVDPNENPPLIPVPSLAQIDALYPANRLRLSLTLRAVNSTDLPWPEDLRGLRFNDPRVVERFERVLDFVFGKIPNVGVLSLQVGNEVDLHELDPAFFADFADFLARIKAYVALPASAGGKGYYGKVPFPIGVTATLRGLISPPTRDIMKLVNQASDVVDVTYYPFPSGTDFTLKDPRTAYGDIATLISTYPDKPIYFQEIGYASSPLTRGSLTKQAQFVDAIFQIWEAYGSRIPYIQFLKLYDSSPEFAERVAGSPPYSRADPVLAAFIRTLGLRTREGSGEDKPALERLRWYRTRFRR